jgi:hypothetical protein
MVPPPAPPLKVKNTFIQVDERFIEDDWIESGDEQPQLLNKRQVTEPCPARRQFTPVGPVGKASKEEAEKTADDGSLDSVSGWNRYVTDDSQDPPIPASMQFAGPSFEIDPYVIQGWIPAGMMEYQIPLATGSGHGLELQEPPPASWNGTLTVMMRNLPNKYTQQMLLDEINANGFNGAFDFLYLPIDPETKANRGYAFINFVDEMQSWAFKMRYEGQQIGHFNSGKVITVMPATLQGFEANHAHYASARVSRGDPSTRPLFLRQPYQQQPYQQPIANRQAPMPTQRRRRGRMSLIDAAAQRAAQGGSGQANEVDNAGVTDGSSVFYCPYCGGKASKGFRFCQFCGSEFPAF